MISATSDPTTFRMVLKGAYEDRLTRGDAVCLLRVGENGLEVVYLYHQMYRRAVDGSTWTLQNRQVMPMGEGAKAQISHLAMLEVWKRAFVGVVEMGSLPTTTANGTNTGILTDGSGVERRMLR